MKVVVQRCKNASVKVSGRVVGQVDDGLMLLVGFTNGDDIKKIEAMAKKICSLRIFPDKDGVMNESLTQVGGSILSISQFTLYANTAKGNRPSYVEALAGDEAIKLYERFNDELRKYAYVETGMFGRDMEVTFTNMGPTTIILEK